MLRFLRSGQGARILVAVALATTAALLAPELGPVLFQSVGFDSAGLSFAWELRLMSIFAVFVAALAYVIYRSMAHTNQELRREVDMRREVERALRERDERIRLLIDGTKDFAIFMLDPDGKVVSWNAGAERLNGYKSHEIIGQHFSRFYTEADLHDEKPARNLAIALAAGRHEEESQRVRRDGSLFWANVVITAVRDQEGRLRGFSKITHDITRRKAAEAGQHQAKTQLHAFFETSPLMMGIVDLLDDDILHVSDNQATAAFFGVSAEAMHTGSARLLGVPDDIRATWLRHYRECDQTGRPVRFEYEHPTACGPRWLAVIVSQVGASPAGNTRCSYVAQDITNQRRTEQWLARSKALVQLLQAVATASNQAHTLEDALADALHEICAYTGWPLGHVYMVNDDGALVSTPFWHGDTAGRYAAFRAASDEVSFTLGVGMPGRVLASGQPVWATDFAQNPSFPRAAVAAASGIESAFALPILLGDEVVGIVECFTSVPTEPDHDLLGLMGRLGQQLGRVAERERAASTLEQSERRFRTLATFAPVGIFESDLAGQTVFVNDVWCQITGMPAAEALGEGWTRLIHPDDRALMFAAWQQAVAGAQVTAEARFLRDDGRIVWFLASVTPLHSTDGLPHGYLGTVLDISERKRLEDEVRQQRDLYESLLQAMSDLGEGVAVAEKSQFVFANEAYCKLTGYSYDELLALPTTLRVMAPGSVEVAAQAIAHVNGGNLSGHVEAELLRKDGQIAPVEFASKATQVGGRLQRISVVRDASARKQAEARLLEGERRFRGIFNSTFQFIALLEPDGTVLEVNQTALDFGGLSIDDVRGKRFWNCYWWLISPELQQHTRDAVQQAASGTLARFDVEVQGAGGIRVIIDFSIKPIKDDSGAVVLLIPEGRDITAVKQMEHSIRQQRDHYATLLQLLSDLGEGVTISSAGRLLFVNDAICRITGYTSEELLALDGTTALIAPEDIPVLTERSRRATAGEEVGPVDCQLIHKQGHRVAIDATSKIFRQDDQIRSIAVVRDVTERKREQQALRDFAARLEVSNRELQDFAYVASHDFQEPLRKIQAFGDRLKSKYASALGDQGGDYLERMQRAAARMQSLINDLLAFSRIATMPEPFKPIDLAALAQDVLLDLEARVADTGGRVELGELPVIEADPLQMRQLLQNLIGNALKFHAPGTTPVVRVSARVEVTAERDAPSYQLLVADNGIGFDEKYLDRIFTPFQRLHGRDSYEGTGMGLAICRRIAERHKGSITATSAPGRGTTFVVTLPSTQPKGGLGA